MATSNTREPHAHVHVLALIFQIGISQNTKHTCDNSVGF